jgi:hypothetical protein
MTAFARLRDVFLPGREPDRAVFCTYGFDTRFFEAEVLPAMLPESLALDREAGSWNAYVNAADVALQRRGVVVFYDHLLGDGPELIYASWPVDMLPRRFHAKLILLDYGDSIRAVVGSANLTRAAWTSLLELWVVEDLMPGVPHPWTSGLQLFLSHLARHVPAQEAQLWAGISSMLQDVPTGGGQERIASTWDEPLLDALFASLPPVTALDVVTPFFEGSEGPGVFDALRQRAANARGQLYASVTTDEGRPQISGPPAKLAEVFSTKKWRLNRVRAVWDGDEDDAPLRSLHGKLLAATHADGARVMIGSANMTRAALLGRASTPENPGRANVELVLLRDSTRRELTALLPQADPLDFTEVEVVDRGDPTGEDDEEEPGPERYIVAATYRAESRLLQVLVAPDAPELALTYDGRALEEAPEHRFEGTFELGTPRYVVVDDGTATGMMPFTVVDPERLLPRGTSRSIDLETFLGLLAGGRDLPVRGGDDRAGVAASVGVDVSIVGTGGAIPWRRYLAAVRGLGGELERERDGARGLAFVLDNPIRMAGLIAHLDDAYDRRRFTAADLLYALYELESELARVRDLTTADDCTAMLNEAIDVIKARRDDLLALTGEEVARQIALLTRADAKR